MAFKTFVYIGVDPGKSGAFCCIVPDHKLIYFKDNKEQPADIANWINTIKGKYPIKIIMLEKVHAIFGTSAGSNFSFGYNTGGPNWLAESIGCGVDHVTPKVWQKYLGVTKKGKAIKKNVAEIITKLYPKAEIYGPRGGLLDGRADALAIAHFASHKWRL